MLTDDELLILAGGYDTDEEEPGTVSPLIINGPGSPTHSDGHGFGDGWGQGDSGAGVPGSTSQPPPPPDSSSQDVIVTFSRPLTQAEQQAVDNLKARVASASGAINAMPDDAYVLLPNGDVVTGKELKELWARTDFYINEVGTGYANGTTRGEADYNGGDPKVSFNIDLLSRYNVMSGGIEYLIFHEIGHMTLAGQRSNAAMDDDGVITAAEVSANEQLANDIARAIVNAVGLEQFQTATEGYSTPAPLPFEVPQPSGDRTGGGGSGPIGDSPYGDFPGTPDDWFL
jgi:hypothetical protein